MSRRAWAITVVFLLLAGSLWAQRGRFRGGFDDYMPYPADGDEKTEFAFARLQYPSPGGGFGFRRGFGSWATDYPKADRIFAMGVRRLTRVHIRSVEQVVDLETDEIFNWPWLYAVEVGRWGFSPEQGAKLREYLDRGGFLMTDDFHGILEWEYFMEGLRQAFPTEPVTDIGNEDPIFHVVYDLSDRSQVPGIGAVMRGVTYERDGIEPRWRAVYDDHERIVVAITHNQDLGDAWEWADDPNYPEHFASQAYRVAVNYIMYAFTH